MLDGGEAADVALEDRSEVAVEPIRPRRMIGQPDDLGVAADTEEIQVAVPVPA